MSLCQLGISTEDQRTATKYLPLHWVLIFFFVFRANGYEPYVPEKSFGHFEMEDSLFKVGIDPVITSH